MKKILVDIEAISPFTLISLAKDWGYTEEEGEIVDFIKKCNALEDEDIQLDLFSFISEAIKDRKICDVLYWMQDAPKDITFEYKKQVVEEIEVARRKIVAEKALKNILNYLDRL